MHFLFKLKTTIVRLISYLILTGLVSWVSLTTANADKSSPLNGLRIAFMPDVHFHDIYANFPEGAFRGLLNSKSGRYATIRSLSAELNSTRLFNENYFALLAALDDVAARGITYVVLPGDFSDDGQPIHLRGLAKILESYRQQYGITFFATTGNHDPVRPVNSPGGETDFLGVAGYEQRIFSRGMAECNEYRGSVARIKTRHTLNTICNEMVQHSGYHDVMHFLAPYGFYPQADYRYWETPYSDNKVKPYQYKHALARSKLSLRQYEICKQGSGGKFKQKGFTDCTQVPDSSYLVEPVPGLWLLAIDANVYIPNEDKQFESSGNAGYNKMFTHKTHVMNWIGDVVQRASSQNKVLIAFSHFPMAEFYDDQSSTMANTFGKHTHQLRRKPEDKTGQLLANMGIKVHIGGHMHMNDTSVIRTPAGKTLFNIQAPSIAAYRPAYKLITLRNNHQIEVETIQIEEVPRFDELFEHYEAEYKTLQRTDPDRLWNHAILDSKTYREFTDWHIRELTRQRFIPNEWPQHLRNSVFELTGKQLLVLSQWRGTPEAFADNGDIAWESILTSPEWHQASERAQKNAEKAGRSLHNFGDWTGMDIGVDFYRLRNAGSLALQDIAPKRLAEYRLLNQIYNDNTNSENFTAEELPHISKLRQQLSQVLTILDGFETGAPDNHFLLDTEKGLIQALKPNGK
ncbi:metallophosphoesterase family protein [Teredinibacter haidensis]|uniref:metallophosphoesterase family protein n=1 Tax=Teredinibacter haidensis TaxID=2731755 RepID=UPI00094901ED|nr:metallophosphoesterase [Teredinibacter haidensis]